MAISKESVIVDKSFDFAERIVKLYKYLINEKKEYILSKQILRCGTSIGAMYLKLMVQYPHLTFPIKYQ